MSHLKTQKSRSLVSPLMVVVTSFALATLLSCGKDSDIEASRQPKKRLERDVNVKNAPTATEQTTKTSTVAWICASCGHQNTKPGDTCTGCRLSKQDIRDNVTKRKRRGTVNPHKRNSNIKESTKKDPTFQQDEAKETCPVCFEEDELTDDQSYQCNQCKKLICVECHKRMKKASMHFCPLCRYEPKHRGRSYSEPVRNRVS